MVKKSSYDTADCSDAEDVQRWMEEASTRRSTTRGSYKTYRGVPTKTAQEKKASKAARQKKWRMAKKTDAA